MGPLTPPPPSWQGLLVTLCIYLIKPFHLVILKINELTHLLNLIWCISFYFLNPLMPEFSDLQNPDNVQPHTNNSYKNATP